MCDRVGVIGIERVLVLVSLGMYWISRSVG